MPDRNLSKLVEGYNRAFIDSCQKADLSYTPQLLTNSNGGKVLTEIECEMKDCDSMFFSVAFITKGGLAPLKGVLKELERKNVPGRILTTDYLTFSEPDALDCLNALKNIEVRMFRSSDLGFHTKGYMFRHGDEFRTIIGSSNLTQNALARNHEWNTKIISTSAGEYAQSIESEFDAIWESSACYDECKNEYREAYCVKQANAVSRPDVNYSLELPSKEINPNDMQSAFSDKVEELLRQGENRGLLISATGTGKTYASAFAVRNLFAKELVSKKKVLFVSHRELINTQAEKSYRRVLGRGFRMAQISGKNQDAALMATADVVFSTVNMMSKDEFRQKHFVPEHFSIIILDECHRAGADSYLKIIQYFEPEFLLGMSASPDRSDGVDVYQLFDHNIACEIRLQNALEENLLCPFHYFGISDLFVDGNFRSVEDFRHLVSDKRVDYIVEMAEYYGYSGDRLRGLMFCSSKAEARELSTKLNERGYNTIALTGEDDDARRKNAIERLETKSADRENQLDYILTVDIFNEGVDIPEINQVIMLRPTESAIIFVQQLGRGLRKAAGKEFVVVLDFIANYDSNYLIPVALSGDRTGNKDNIRKSLVEGNKLIKGASTIYFDEVSRDRIFRSLDKARLNQKKVIMEGYNSFKRKLGRRPRLSEFDSLGEMDPLRILSYVDSNAECKSAKMCSYYGFLVRYDGLEDSLSIEDNHLLEFVSQKFASGKRLNEIIMLEVLVSAVGTNDVIDEWQRRCTAEGLCVDSFACENIISVMTGGYYAVGSSRRFCDCPLIEKSLSGDGYVASALFRAAMSKPAFVDELNEVIAFARGRYENVYRSTDRFAIGQKYTYEDVFRLLDWEKDEVSLNVGGYKFDARTKTYPVFVNYDKSDDISETTKYHDRFQDRSTLYAISKSKRTVKSKDVLIASNSVSEGVRMDLFVRKNKDDQESKEFYYLGRIRHPEQGLLREFLMPNTNVSAVEIEYKLETPVERSLYDYLTAANI